MKEITGNLRQDVKDLLGESASLFTGFMSIIFAVSGRYDSAAWAILFSALMDGLDGKVARLTLCGGRPRGPSPAAELQRRTHGYRCGKHG